MYCGVDTEMEVKTRSIINSIFNYRACLLTSVFFIGGGGVYFIYSILLAVLKRPVSETLSIFVQLICLIVGLFFFILTFRAYNFNQGSITSSEDHLRVLSALIYKTNRTASS